MGWFKITVPKEFIPTISFIVFTATLVAGTNLYVRTATMPLELQPRMQGGEKVRWFVKHILLYIITLVIYMVWSWPLSTGLIFSDAFDFQTHVMPERSRSYLIFLVWVVAVMIIAIGPPLGCLLYALKDRFLVLIASGLFIIMSGCLLLIPIGSSNTMSSGLMIWSYFGLLQVCWFAVILFSPLQQLTRRLGFVVLGVLTLIGLSEISKLNLHQYLHPAKVSEIPSITHNAPSHAATTSYGATGGVKEVFARNSAT